MATKRLKKGENPLDRVTAIERQIKTWRTKMLRASNKLKELERQRTYYVKAAVERGLA